VTAQAGSAAVRRLVLLRHSKSDWPDVPDAERPLSARGERDAPAVGRWLRDAGVVPERVLCSTARRTRQTWKLVAQQLRAKPTVSYDERLYEASSDVVLEVVRETPAAVETLLVIGHNPAVQALTLSLAGSAVGDALDRARDSFPTSALALLSFHGDWAAAAEGCARLVDLTAPRG
jgi:phosphohistidine phosphatase